MSALFFTLLLAQSFTPTGSMTAARQGHTAILLPDGKVLIAGSAANPAAEVYDPDTGVFAPVPNLNGPWHPITATLLGDGRVLLLRAETTGNIAVLYDPATNTLAEAGSTSTHQTGGFAILLNTGKVLIAGGGMDLPRNGPVPLADPELYDPSTGTFTPTGGFASTEGTFYITGGPDISAMSLLPDGKVLLAGERHSEVYDPATGTFSLTNPMTTSCSFGSRPPEYLVGRTATLLQDGNILLTGGEQEACGRFKQAEIYDASIAKFAATGDMIRPRDNHASTLLRDGTVLITGGETQDGGDGGYVFSGTTASVESYDPGSGHFTAT